MNTKFADDFPEISKKIKEKHKKFLKNLGKSAEKILADYELYINMALSKIRMISCTLKEAGVIDDFIVDDKRALASVVFVKKGTASTLEILTNGKMILFRKHSYSSILENSPIEFSEKFANCNSDKFNWVVFSEKLIDNIHNTIYESKEANEVKFSSLFTK